MTPVREMFKLPNSFRRLVIVFVVLVPFAHCSQDGPSPRGYAKAQCNQYLFILLTQCTRTSSSSCSSDYFAGVTSLMYYCFVEAEKLGNSKTDCTDGNFTNEYVSGFKRLFDDHHRGRGQCMGHQL